MPDVQQQFKTLCLFVQVFLLHNIQAVLFYMKPFFTRNSTEISPQDLINEYLLPVTYYLTLVI